MAPNNQTQMTRNPLKKHTQMTKNPLVVTSSSDDDHMYTDAVTQSKKSPEAQEESSSEDTSQNDQSKPKETNVATRPEKKPARFERKFSVEDELAVLKGIVKLISKTKSSKSKVFPLDMDALRLCIKRLSFNASNDQLESKIKRLKNIFRNAISKSSVSKKSNSKFFELSKEIWGDELCKPLENFKGESSNGGGSEIPPFLYAQNLMSLDEPKFHACWDMIPDGPKKREMETRFQTIKATQADLCSSRTQIIADAAKVVFDNQT